MQERRPPVLEYISFRRACISPGRTKDTPSKYLCPRLWLCITVKGEKRNRFSNLRLLLLASLNPSSQKLFVDLWGQFLGRTQTKVFRVFLLAIHSHLYNFAFLMV
jgi:hypothetical protein